MWLQVLWLTLCNLSEDGPTSAKTQQRSSLDKMKLTNWIFFWRKIQYKPSGAWGFSLSPRRLLDEENGGFSCKKKRIERKKSSNYIKKDDTAAAIEFTFWTEMSKNGMMGRSHFFFLFLFACLFSKRRCFKSLASLTASYTDHKCRWTMKPILCTF